MHNGKQDVENRVKKTRKQKTKKITNSKPTFKSTDYQQRKIQNNRLNKIKNNHYPHYPQPLYIKTYYMKFTCLRENLVQGLQAVMHVSGKNITLPILNNVLIRATEGLVEFTSTNLEIAIVSEIRAKVDVPGSFTVPARTFADYVQLLTGEQTALEVTEKGELLIDNEKSKTKIKGEGADEFPIVPGTEGGATFKFNTAVLREALAHVVFAVSRSEVRPELSGVLFHVNGEQNKGVLFLAATDSYRLSEKKVAVQNEEKEREVRIIVPARTVQEMIRVLLGVQEEITEIVVSEGQISMAVPGVKIISRLIEGRYPDYRQIIPSNFSGEALLDTIELTQQVRAAGLFSTSGVNAVSLGFAPDDGAVTLASASAQLGEFSSAVSGGVTGGENTVLLNHRYVLDGLQHMDTGKVRIQVVKGDAPCVFSPDGKSDFLYIVMPIKQ